MMSGRSSFLFTASQWQELEHQALIFKYMVAGIPIPSDLLFTIKTSLDSSLSSSNLLLHPPQPIGWNCYQMGMGYGRKIDPEPGRCRRTDGKKWRCSKEAYPDSKYCERHMHRGRNRSRKPVDITTTTTSITNTNNNNSPSSTISKIPTFPTRPPPVITLDPSPPYFHTDKDYRRNNRYGDEMKEEVDEHVFFSETSQTMRSSSGSTSVDDCWQLRMGSSLNRLEHGYSSLQQLQRLNDSPKQQKPDHHYYGYGSDVKYETPSHSQIERDDGPRKVMHHFFDEWPPRTNKDSWLDSEHRSSNQKPVSDNTQLSISMPNYSHDFLHNP